MTIVLDEPNVKLKNDESKQVRLHKKHIPYNVLEIFRLRIVLRTLYLWLVLFFLFFSKELEKETTERVKLLFEDIDKVLYADDGVTEKGYYNQY